MRLADWDPEDTLGWDKGHKMNATLDKTIEKLDKLQYRLYAENKRALLIVLQGMDAAGKDGTIRHVMPGLNPQGCQVTSFKQPGVEELAHDFLWRIHQAVPRHGDIGIFNRSHYEDVLVVRVHDLVPKDVWRSATTRSTSSRKCCTENGTTILKFFLHISKDEQKKRFQQRLDDPDRRWKISRGRLRGAEILGRLHARRTRTRSQSAARKHAPWFVIPANKKWFRNLAVSHIITETLEEHGHEIPAPTVDIKKLKWK